MPWIDREVNYLVYALVGGDINIDSTLDKLLSGPEVDDHFASLISSQSSFHPATKYIPRK